MYLCRSKQHMNGEMFFMAEKVKRTKQSTQGIYFNENSQKYDIKYNYTVYNPEKTEKRIQAKVEIWNFFCERSKGRTSEA